MGLEMKTEKEKEKRERQRKRDNILQILASIQREERAVSRLPETAGRGPATAPLPPEGPHGPRLPPATTAEEHSQEDAHH